MIERSWPELRIPIYRKSLLKSTELWLKKKRIDDAAEGLWRINDDLYDLTSFIDQHPGGEMWLSLTKGTDITEAFEVHHFSKTAEHKLPEFFVRKARAPRNYPFTFHPDGFYRVFKERCRKYYHYKKPPVSWTSTLFLDFYFFFGLSCCILAAFLKNIPLAVLAGLLFGCVVNCGHNLVHMRNSWRTYYYYFTSFSTREWRIFHCLSHHLLANTLDDLEIALFEPYLEYLPKKDKHWFVRFGSWVYFPVICAFATLSLLGSRLLNCVFMKEDFLMFIPLALMLIFGKSITWSVCLWLVTISTAGFVYALIGMTAGHHDYESFHEGDKAREDRDWGLHQIDATQGRTEIDGNIFLGLIMFGDHTLHHLFPTIDCIYLKELMPIFRETLEEFGIELFQKRKARVFINSFIQLARNEPNTKPREQLRF